MAEKQVAPQPSHPPLQPPFAPRPIPPDTPKPYSPSTSISALPNGDLHPSPVLEKAAEIPLTAAQSLPTIIGRNSEDIELVESDIHKFLENDLDLSRLNIIHTHLWMAGRPLRARPLHRYRMMHFEVLHTQQMDLHLLNFSNRILLKPLAEYMLDHTFWSTHICPHQEFHEAACGFLLSYIWLITSPLDLKLAHECFLLPSFITWHWWKEFVHDFYSNIDVNALDQVNKRFHFGDLRLGRINSIYRFRFLFTHFVRGYLYGYNRYVVFFERNFSWILVVFVFFSLVLSAMQVGTAVEPLHSNGAFQNASYGFVVFSMLTVGFVLALVGTIFAVVFLYNMVAAISHDKTARRERAKKAEARNRAKDA